MSRPLRLAGPVAAILLLFTACMSLEPLPPGQLNSADLPARIWVTDAAHANVPLDAPLLIGDTLAGFVRGEFREWQLQQTKSIKSRQVAPGRTAALAAVTGAVTLGAFLYLESRKDVGSAQVCLNTLDQRPQPFTPCCVAQDTVPC
jgi:hypothetical protein